MITGLSLMPSLYTRDTLVLQLLAGREDKLLLKSVWNVI